MGKYRFKTKEEFIACGEWDSFYNYPDGWNSDMAYRVGQDVPDEYTKECDGKNSFYIKEYNGDKWHYNRDNYILKEISKDVKGFEIHEVKEIKI